MSENSRRHVFISHASEDKQEIASPLAEALSNSDISVWYDEYEIIWGDSIFEKINEGLSKSLIGIVIFSPHFLNKNWPTIEFRTIASLMIKQKIRMLPLLHNISLEEITTKYPLLEGIRFQSSNTDISILVEQVKKNISKFENLRLPIENKSHINSQLTTQFPNMNDDEASQMEMNIIHPVSEEIKQAAIEKLSFFAEKQAMWNNEKTWNILDNLIFNKNDNDIRDALDIILKMIKLSKDDKVMSKINEFYYNQLINIIYNPEFKIRIRSDTWAILRHILPFDELYGISIEALNHGIINIRDNNVYGTYISSILKILDQGNANQFREILENMTNLMKHDNEKVRKRALEIHDEYLRKV